MSEQDRNRLYAWLREHAGEPNAEYLMSCLSPAPLSDLVTKDFLSAAFADDRERRDAQREADRKEDAARWQRLEDQREADRREYADERKADRKEYADERKADRKKTDRQVRALWAAFAVLFAQGWAADAGLLGDITDFLTGLL